ncbi:MAG TPA: hypothetical protein VJ973_00820 [Christiangramia sp.]|nr:hypothetical protein [Christiangramia sp.]
MEALNCSQEPAISRFLVRAVSTSLFRIVSSKEVHHFSLISFLPESVNGSGSAIGASTFSNFGAQPEKMMKSKNMFRFRNF